MHRVADPSHSEKAQRVALVGSRWVFAPIHQRSLICEHCTEVRQAGLTPTALGAANAIIIQGIQEGDRPAS